MGAAASVMGFSYGIQAEDELEGLAIGILVAVLAGTASHDGGLVEEAGGQVVEGALGLGQGDDRLVRDLGGSLGSGL